MIQFRLWLRRTVEAKLTREFAKFAGLKSLISAISFGSVWLWTLRFQENNWVTLTNSIVTQVVEFFILRKYVFTDVEKNRLATRGQVVKFAAVAVALGVLETHLLNYYFWRLQYPFWAAYFYAHVPTFPLRFVLERYWVYRKPTPSS